MFSPRPAHYILSQVQFEYLLMDAFVNRALLVTYTAQNESRGA